MCDVCLWVSAFSEDVQPPTSDYFTIFLRFDEFRRCVVVVLSSNK
jgi:hypothetical protein